MRASPRWPRWCSDATLDPATRTALENAGRALRARTRDVIGEWAALLTDREALGDGLRAARARAVLRRASWTSMHRWCVERDACARRGTLEDDGERYALDAEDDALLLRIYQLQRGPLPGGKGARSPTST